MKQFALLALFACGSAHASLSPECMGARGGSWYSLELSFEMRPAECPASMELQEGLYMMRYERSLGPQEVGQKTVCHWKWVPGRSGLLAPAGNAPDTVICSLEHRP